MNTLNDVKNQAQHQLKKGAENVQQSAQDWYAYVQDHPMQTLLFGAVIYFALKGFARDLVPNS